MPQLNKPHLDNSLHATLPQLQFFTSSDKEEFNRLPESRSETQNAQTLLNQKGLKSLKVAMKSFGASQLSDDQSSEADSFITTTLNSPPSMVLMPRKHKLSLPSQNSTMTNSDSMDIEEDC